MSSLELAQELKKKFGDLISDPAEFRGEVTVVASDTDRLAEVFQHAKEQLGFDYLVDISSVDNFDRDPRFTLVYELYGYGHKNHLRIKADVSEESSEAPTISHVWRTADWHEREIYDMMGIRFSGHPDLRRILMWEGYPYFPLRKDFPLSGKETELPDIAFTQRAPLDGGPFVAPPGGKDRMAREPRVRTPEEKHVATNARVERRDDQRKTEIAPGREGE